MSAWRSIGLALFTLFTVAVVVPGLHAETTHCMVPDSGEATPPATVPFSVYRVGTWGTDVHWRDLELSWDPLNDSTVTQDVRTTLGNFAGTLVDTLGRNPFSVNCSDIQLIYEYFRNRRYGSSYTLTPTDTTSMWFGVGVGGYWGKDRSHVDVYLLHRSRVPYDGRYTSPFDGPDEDVSTGHPSGEVLHENSLALRTPTWADRFDLSGTGWTKPDSTWAMHFAHEFRHGLSGTKSGGLWGETLSGGAEAIGGNRTVETSDELPYTWALFRYNPMDLSVSNYPARSAFAAYLAYNFPGADTSPTLDGILDDLLRKWEVDSAASLVTLRRLLRDDSCGTCAGKTYFHPGDTPMSDTLRLALLLHNWRVANFANSSALAEGQYGFPP